MFSKEKNKNTGIAKSHILFNAIWYREVYLPNSSYTNEEVFDHYVKNPQNNPSVFFDTEYYLRLRRISISELKTTPLEHYISNDSLYYSPICYFDLEFYMNAYPDVVDNALEHFLLHGWRELRDPNPLFSTSSYFDRYPDVKDADMNPLEHYILIGNLENRIISSRFDMLEYKKRYALAEDINPLGHFLTFGKNSGFHVNPINESLNNLDVSTKQDNTLIYEELKKFHSPSDLFYEPLSKDSFELPHDSSLKTIAFYLPQFHEIEENNEWWGNGFTEWRNVTKGLPRYKNHYQPRLPKDLGFYDITTGTTFARQIELARKNGIYGFCFHVYWFSGKRLLEKPLEILLENKSLDIPFCICWANENWTRRWDGFDKDVLIEQDFLEIDTQAFIKDMEKYITDSRYIRINNRPLIVIYRPQLIPNFKKVVMEWREYLISKGHGNPLIACVLGFNLKTPTDYACDFAVEFPPHNLATNLNTINHDVDIYDSNFSGNIHSYNGIVDRAKQLKVDFPLARGIFPNWDNESRLGSSAGTSFANSTPIAYQDWLEYSLKYSKDNPIEGDSIMFINAWNEWAEGAYLEPDLHYGFAYLNATKNAVRNIYEGREPKDTYKIIVVSHDAHPHGAQLLTLNIVKTLKKKMGLDVITLLLEGGELEENFSEITKTYNFENCDISTQNTLIKDLKNQGYDTIILNSVASSKIIDMLTDFDFTIVSLIHELSNMLEQHSSIELCKKLEESSKQIVFASSTVEEHFLRFTNSKKSDIHRVHPQGIYQLDLLNNSDLEEGMLKDLLKIDESDFIVLGAGFADLRKGVDLFIHIANFTIQKRQDVHFVWMGNMEDQIKQWIIPDIDKSSYKENIHFLDYQKDYLNLAKDADVFILTSREDPYPSVALDLLALNVPVIAFENSGGITDINKFCEDAIQVVPYLDTVKMSEKILQFLEMEKDILQVKMEGASRYIKDNYQFDNYVHWLLSNLYNGLQKISVVITNYNYAHHLEERLLSIWNQTYPVFEVIILDDASTDDSLEMIEKLCKKYSKEVKIVQNQQNSGSVFKQWHKAVSIARGDLIWIAEADDSSHPNFLLELQSYSSTNDLKMVYCQSKQIDENGKLIASDYKYYTSSESETKWQLNYTNKGNDEIVEALGVKNTILNVSSVLWCKDTLEDVISQELENLSKYVVAGDWYLYIAFLKKHNMGFYAKSLNVHRRHNSSVTSKLDAKRHVEEIEEIQGIVREIYQLDNDVIERSKIYIDEVKEYLRL